MSNAIRYNYVSQYHNVAPSFPLNEMLHLELPSKKFFFLSMSSLATEQLFNPSQTAFLCSGIQDGIWDSYLPNCCFLEVTRPARWLSRALAVSPRVVGGCCQSQMHQCHPLPGARRDRVPVGTRVSRRWCAETSVSRILFFMEMLIARNVQIHFPRLRLSPLVLHTVVANSTLVLGELFGRTNDMILHRALCELVFLRG